MRVVRRVGVSRTRRQLIVAERLQLIAVGGGGFRHDGGSRVDFFCGHCRIHVKNEPDHGKGLGDLSRTYVSDDIIRVDFVKWVDQYLSRQY